MPPPISSKKPIESRLRVKLKDVTTATDDIRTTIGKLGSGKSISVKVIEDAGEKGNWTELKLRTILALNTVATRFGGKASAANMKEVLEEIATALRNSDAGGDDDGAIQIPELKRIHDLLSKSNAAAATQLAQFASSFEK